MTNTPKTELNTEAASIVGWLLWRQPEMAVKPNKYTEAADLITRQAARIEELEAQLRTKK